MPGHQKEDKGDSYYTNHSYNYGVKHLYNSNKTGVLQLQWSVDLHMMKHLKTVISRFRRFRLTRRLTTKRFMKISTLFCVRYCDKSLLHDMFVMCFTYLRITVAIPTTDNNIAAI